MERSREGYGPREALRRRGLDPGNVPQDLGDVHPVAVRLDDPPLRVEEEGRGQPKVLPVHEEMAVEDRVAATDVLAGDEHGDGRHTRGRGADLRLVLGCVERDGYETDAGPGEGLG